MKRTRKIADPELLWQAYRRRRTEAARNALAEHYLPLVRQLALRAALRTPPNVTAEELESDGFLGLLDAIERFDPVHRVPFARYAARRITGAMLDGLRAMDHVPRNRRQRDNARTRLEQDYYVLHGRMPQPGVLDELAGGALPAVQSLEKMLTADNETVLRELHKLSSTERPSAWEQACEIEELTKGLDLQQRVIIYLYFIRGLRMRDVGDLLGVSESYISQLTSQAIRMLRRRD